MSLSLIHLASFVCLEQQHNPSTTTKQKILNLFNKGKSFFCKNKEDLYKQKTLASLDKLRSCISAIQDERNKFNDNFSIIANELIEKQDFFKDRDIKSILEKEASLQETAEELSADSDYTALQNELRLLFFTNLIARCNMFFTNIRHMIFKATAPGAPLNCDNMNELFERIFAICRTKNGYKWFNKNLADVNFLSEFKHPILVFRFFAMLLETEFCNKKDVSIKSLRNCLYGSKSFNIWDHNYIDVLYFTLGHFLQHYNYKNKSINQ
ncbi:hypothetical protein CDIK_2948 [Cucumispora dikerogammari]|nr:hypothetical protein CDIK_2948 [Cucumispora dikerogammari]